MAKNNNLPDFLKDVADAIREKKGTSNLINPQDFSSEIEAIQTSNIDLSQTTATADDVLEGKEFYNASGEKVTGTYKDKLQWKCDNLKTLRGEFSYIKEVDNVDIMLNGLNTNKVVNMYQMFFRSNIKTIPSFDTSSVTIMSQMFAGISSNENNEIQVIPALNTINVTNFSQFAYRAGKLTTIELLDLRNATNVKDMFEYCTNLTNLTLKNIKISLQIGNGSSWGHLLTLDSLLNTFKELWNNTDNVLGGTQTLTIGSANLDKISNIYIKLVTITDEMRAEDEYIDNKDPFIQCESTDDGAMLITEYVTTVKNWQLA